MKIPKGVSAYHCGSSRSESSLKDLASVMCDSCSAPLHRVGIHDARRAELGRKLRPAAACGVARRRGRLPGAPVMLCDGAKSRRRAG